MFNSRNMLFYIRLSIIVNPMKSNITDLSLSFYRGGGGKPRNSTFSFFIKHIILYSLLLLYALISDYYNF